MPTSDKRDPVRLVVVIPFHQPLRASDAELEQAYTESYLPILEALEQHDQARVAVHFTGHLLDYVSKHHEDFLLRLKHLAHDGRVEILGGLFYGALPSLLPELDVRGQVEMAAEFWESLLGETPRGFWLPELCWSSELTRLLDETGLEYGFVAASQLLTAPGAVPRSLVHIERGGQSIAAFVLDADLSAQVGARGVGAWVDTLLERAGTAKLGLVTVSARAEALGRGGADRAWLDEWLSALSGGRPEIETALPATSVAAAKPAVPAAVTDACAPEIHALARGDGSVAWTDFPREFPEVDTLHRRMLQVSTKLREHIALMEEEGHEEAWSDPLATAQRLVFSAQALDAYWRGPVPGFSDPRNRAAATMNLVRAEAMIDALVQGEDDWIGTEEEDGDGDLVDEVFVANRHVTVWVASEQGAFVRSLDVRASGRNVLDVGSWRAAGSPAEGQGVRERLFDQGTSAAELFAGTARDLTPPGTRYEVERNEIGEEDGTYQLAVRGTLALEGPRSGNVEVAKRLTVPIDGPELSLEYHVKSPSGSGLLLATEIPLRLGDGPWRLLADGNPVDLTSTELVDVSVVRLEDAGGSALELHCEPALDVWVSPIRASVQDLDGARVVEQGVVLVPVLRLEVEEEQARVTLKIGPAPAPSETSEQA